MLCKHRYLDKTHDEGYWTIYVNAENLESIWTRATNDLGEDLLPDVNRVECDTTWGMYDPKAVYKIKFYCGPAHKEGSIMALGNYLLDRYGTTQRIFEFKTDERLPGLPPVCYTIDTRWRNMNRRVRKITDYFSRK